MSTPIAIKEIQKIVSPLPLIIIIKEIQLEIGFIKKRKGSYLR